MEPRPYIAYPSKPDLDLTSLIDRAVAKREVLRKKTNAVRLVNGAGDGIPGIAVEQYDKHFVIFVFDAKNSEIAYRLA